MNSVVYYNQGTKRYHDGDYNIAIDAFTKAIELDPTDGGIYHNRGYAREKMGDKQGATNDYNQASILGIGGES
jgi:Flp pilus assembly protein TadD